MSTTVPKTTVVIPTDFTPVSRNAALFAVQLFRDQDVRYVLMHSHYEPPIAHDALYSSDDLKESNTENKLEKEKAFLEKVLQDWKLNIECVSIFGILVSAINEAVDRYNADYVVIGNKADYDLESKLLGYKTANFIRKIKCPVLSVPGDYEFDNIQEITFASDLKRIKHDYTLEPVLPIIKTHNTKLNILYVHKEAANLTDEEEEAKRKLSQFFEAANPDFHSEESEFIISGISKFVTQSNTDLVVLLARKHNFFKRLMEKSHTELFSELAGIPLLVLHE